MRFLVYILIFIPFLCFAQGDFERAEVYFQKEEFSKAKPLFQKYLTGHPKHRKTREYLGDIASYTEDWDGAIVFYEELLAEDKNNANYNFKFGAALGMKALSVNRLLALAYIGDIRRSFETAARLDPSHIEARWALVEFYIQLPGIIGGSEEKAIAYAEELERISEVDGQLAKGYIAEYSDRAADAEVHYKKAIEVGGSFHTYEKLSGLYENTNQPENAIDTSVESLKIHKRNQLNYQIGKIAAQYNVKPEVGIVCLQKYLENHTVKDGVPKEWAYYRLAQIYKNQSKKETALLWINKALNDRSDFEEAKKEKEIILEL
jgi:tetratricopeptide (TPR) repeat protein